MLGKTILNRIEKHSSFVYNQVRFREGEGDVLEIEVRPRRGTRAVCSGCSRRRSVYNTMAQREWGSHLRFAVQVSAAIVRKSATSSRA